MQSQCRYIIENNNIIKFLLANIQKLQNSAKVKILVINKMVSLIKVIIDKEKSNIGIKKIKVLTWIKIKQIATETKKHIIFQNTKKFQDKQKAWNG